MTPVEKNAAVVHVRDFLVATLAGMRPIYHQIFALIDQPIAFRAVVPSAQRYGPHSNTGALIDPFAGSGFRSACPLI